MGGSDMFPLSLLSGKHECPIANRNHEEKFVSVPYFRLYFETLWGVIKNGNAFNDVETFCFFIGYERSGHSIVGALLDAHPNAIISHEADVLGLAQKGFGRRQIFSAILENSQKFGATGRGWSGNSFHVPGQWQGKFGKLLVIGDKKGLRSALRLNADPTLYKKLCGTLRRPIKVVHHIRNPYDNIGAIHRVRGETVAKREWIDYYFRLCDAVKNAMSLIPSSDIFEGNHEDFVSDAASHLKKLCGFLNLECPSGYLEACARIVQKVPQESRNDIVWDDELVQCVLEKMRKYDFLAHYANFEANYLPGRH